eukprot:CAMPEP_0168610118 /NCGR_PEP_ID=MMETSP0449_2-20121227/1604_1 /TAXON_ID=1082188 /ORGANISM="Strombidium rassoulzadegani, Strain ras09" /LENGTH=59 /DNA_ID=CAMNT_0008650377 /DNA_START=117 /DNA_END=296 /DNA_ORIENTATION=+
MVKLEFSARGKEWYVVDDKITVKKFEDLISQGEVDEFPIKIESTLNVKNDSFKEKSMLE